jgi:hypothetical protein
VPANSEHFLRGVFREQISDEPRAGPVRVLDLPDNHGHNRHFPMLHPPVPRIQVQPEFLVPIHADVPPLPDVLRVRPPNAEHNRADPDHI